MGAMTRPRPTTVRVDEKGRITLPTRLRQALALQPGDVLFVRAHGDRVELAKAGNPFDVLADHAIREHREGRTRELRQLAREWGVVPGRE